MHLQVWSALAIIKLLCKHTKIGCHGDEVNSSLSFAFSASQMEFTIKISLIKPGNLKHFQSHLIYNTGILDLATDPCWLLDKQNEGTNLRCQQDIRLY